METRVRIRDGGRFVVPVNFRKALKIKAGDEILLRLEGDSLRLIPLQQAVLMAQKAVKQYVPKGKSLVDDLIQARREEAAGE
ncbi:MAG: AbrB/MazE/SpoVT family DNA-binding domain-containing protein [Bacteroidetes bacterium]|nr:AbrB/MazE/SpoVT family DNA-binding domain-containing protein [Bacteroidota bacterium]